MDSNGVIFNILFKLRYISLKSPLFSSSLSLPLLRGFQLGPLAYHQSLYLHARRAIIMDKSKTVLDAYIVAMSTLVSLNRFNHSTKLFFSLLSLQ
jgi:hypothetical protein